MTPEDSIYRFRLRTLALTEELGNVRAACRAMGIHHSTIYRWKRQAEQYGLELLRPRERRRPQMANATSPVVEQRVVVPCSSQGQASRWVSRASARIPAELARPKWGGLRLSANGFWRVLKRHRLNTRAKRLGQAPGPSGWAWSPATRRRPNRPPPSRRRSAIWRPPEQESWCSSTAST